MMLTSMAFVFTVWLFTSISPHNTNSNEPTTQAKVRPGCFIAQALANRILAAKRYLVPIAHNFGCRWDWKKFHVFFRFSCIVFLNDFISYDCLIYQ